MFMKFIRGASARRRGAALAVVCWAIAVAPAARAHFIWIDVKPAKGAGEQAELYFGESPEPGEARLLEKIAKTTVWQRGADGKLTEFKVAPAADGLAALVGTCAEAASCVCATCDYGIYERGPAGVLLHYDAKHLRGDWARGDAAARAERLVLDIVPSLIDGQLQLQVVFQGKPAAASEVVVIDSAGEEQTLKSDADGKISLAANKGRYAVRAAVIEPQRSGQRDGKPYAQTWHYATLTLDVPPGASGRAEISAAELLKQARDARCVWRDFPGFAADIDVYGDARRVTGKATIDASGGVTLELPKSPLADWAEEQLQSLVQHRMPDGDVAEGSIRYADDDTDHPLGRKIDLGDPNQQSKYRIRGDAILEVNRSMGKLRFTISVLELVRNAENKYLPRAFTMDFFDAATGELRASLGYWNDWQRVGAYDLPRTILEIGARAGGTAARQITFSNCRLLEAK